MGLDKSGALTIDEDMSYEAYLAGTGAYAGTGEKTPEWAAGITGVPADTIRELADLYMDGPTATIQGWGPQRHSNGGNNSRAIAMIALRHAHGYPVLPREEHGGGVRFVLRLVSGHRRLHGHERRHLGHPRHR